MRNYLKSEMYRFSKSKTFVKYFKVIAVLIIIFDLLLFAGYKDWVSFIYIDNPTTIAVETLSSMVFILGVFLAFILVDKVVNEPLSDGVLKNSISSGLSRNSKYICDFLTSTVIVILFTLLSIAFHFLLSGALFGFGNVFSSEGLALIKNFSTGLGNGMITLVSYISLCLMFSYSIKNVNSVRVISVFAITLYPLLLNLAKMATDSKFIKFLDMIEITNNINKFQQIYELYSFDLNNALIAIVIIAVTTTIGIIGLNRREVI